MRTGSVRTRVTIVTTVLLVIVLAVVTGAVTLAYGARLQDDLRSRLTAAGTAVARSSSARAPGIWEATSARGSAFGGACCAGTMPAAPQSASKTSNLLANMNDSAPCRVASVIEPV